VNNADFVLFSLFRNTFTAIPDLAVRQITLKEEMIPVSSHPALWLQGVERNSQIFTMFPIVPFPKRNWPRTIVSWTIASPWEMQRGLI
jgi:hypothetical protein